MTQTLDGVGTISYNGWTFSGPRVSSTLSIRPQRDRSGRNVTHDIYTISVVAIVTDDLGGLDGSGGDAGTVMADLQTQLLKDGGQLVYTGMGHGTFSINTSSTTRDVSYGPKTRELICKPIGSIGAFEVRWTVEIHIKRCAGNVLFGRIGNFKAFSYSIDYAIDREGLTSRTVAGSRPARTAAPAIRSPTALMFSATDTSTRG